MYDGPASARAAGDSATRLGWGLVKTLSILLPGYWFVRYLALHANRAAVPERPAVQLFAVIFATQAAIQAISLFGPGRATFGLSGALAGLTVGAIMLLQLTLEVYLSAWQIAWPLGNIAIGPVRSVRIMIGSFWVSIGYSVAVTLTLLVLHYVLGSGAIGRPRLLIWTLLAIDSIVVGFLALTMTARCSWRRGMRPGVATFRSRADAGNDRRRRRRGRHRRRRTLLAAASARRMALNRRALQRLTSYSRAADAFATRC